jgi:hypothetical protein
LSHPDIRGVILGRTCNGQKTVLLLIFLLYYTYWLRDSGRSEFCRSAVLGVPMRGSWEKHPLISLLIVFSFGGYCIYRAMQYDNAMSGERSTITHVHKYDNIKHSYCEYSFTVDGVAYGGRDCPQGIASGYSDASVYYDPSNPSMNALEEFGVASKRWYQYAALCLCVGCIAIGFVLFGGTYANSKRGNGGIVVDAEGTVIYPDKIDPERHAD